MLPGDRIQARETHLGSVWRDTDITSRMTESAQKGGYMMNLYTLVKTEKSGFPVKPAKDISTV